MSIPALIGNLRVPGALTRAHGGLLVIEDYPLLSRAFWEGLRPVLDDHVVHIAGAQGLVRYPTRCQLLLTAHECSGNHSPGRSCSCPPFPADRYRRRRDHLGFMTPRISPTSSTGMPCWLGGRRSWCGEVRSLGGMRARCYRWPERWPI
ncbi:ATP-binding protein [Nocardia alni]|uniref:ATP-binding protein n=1 Tax=Nocardia alni TaxID=2815723 RepID=UPI001C2177F0|nr:ATP-binding protein [Nocardia alni]